MEIDEIFQQAQDKRDNQEIAESISLYQQVREQALEAGDQHLASESLHMIGVAHYQNEDYAGAEEALRTSQEEFEAAGKNDFVGFVLRDRGLVALKQKDFPKAKELLQQSITSLRESNKGHLGISIVKLGVVIAEEGDSEAGEKQIREGIAVIEESDERFFASTAYFDLAKLLRKAGKADEAREAARKSEEILNTIGGEERFKKRRKELNEFLNS